MERLKLKFKVWDEADQKYYFFNISDGIPYYYNEVYPYIGKNDKNSQEIYEQDKVTYWWDGFFMPYVPDSNVYRVKTQRTEIEGIIKWCNNTCRFYLLNTTQNMRIELDQIDFSHLEVII